MHGIKFLLLSIWLFSGSLSANIVMDFGTSNRMAWVNGEFLKRYKRLPNTTVGTHVPYVDLSNENFFNADLSHAYFAEANLSFCDLREANFEKANLMMANLQGAQLASSNLFGAFLMETNFTNANFTKAILIKANFSKAIMRNTNLTKAKLTLADFSGADLSGAYYFKEVPDELLKFPVTLEWLKLKGVKWKDAPILH